MSGATSLARLQAFNKSFGLLGAHSTRPPAVGATSAVLGGAGTATLDLDVRGKWLLPVPDSDNPVASSTAEGSIAIRNAELTTPYLSQPLTDCVRAGNPEPHPDCMDECIHSATGSWRHRERWNIRRCALSSTPCVGHFSLMLPALDLAALQSTLLGSSGGGELLRQILDRIDRHPVQWPDLSGTVQIGALSTGKLVVHDAIGAIDISGNSIRIRSLNGHVANGTMHLAGVVDASGDQPEYQLDVQVTNAAPSALANIFEERWGSGVANFSAQLRMSGLRRAGSGPVCHGYLALGLDQRRIGRGRLRCRLPPSPSSTSINGAPMPPSRTAPSKSRIACWLAVRRRFRYRARFLSIAKST